MINIHTWLELDIAECLSAEFNALVRCVRHLLHLRCFSFAKKIFRSITLTQLKSDKTYNIVTKCVLYTLVMFVIPFVTLIIVNWRIIVALKHSTRMRSRLSTQKSTQK